jgi:hypothetical protein
MPDDNKPDAWVGVEYVEEEPLDPIRHGMPYAERGACDFRPYLWVNTSKGVAICHQTLPSRAQK